MISQQSAYRLISKWREKTKQFNKKGDKEKIWMKAWGYFAQGLIYDLCAKELEEQTESRKVNLNW